MLTPHQPLKNTLLGFLRSRPKPVGEAFRTNPRHKSTARARLAWKEGNKTREVPARLTNISKAGAALLTNVPPPVAAEVLIRLTGDELSAWLEAQVLGVEQDERGRRRVRLLFHEFCPEIFLKAAVLGPLTPSSESTATSSESPY